MRTYPVLFAFVAAAVGAVYGCSLPLDGLSASANSGGAGGAGGERSVTSAGGALSTATGATTASTSTGVSCTKDEECSGETKCKTPKCLDGACGFEIMSHDGTVCGAASGPCFDESLCVDGECEIRPKPAGTVIDDTPGDCTGLRCDGAGKSMTVANTADTPEDKDSTDCNVPTCKETMASTQPLDNGANCQSGKHCFNGQCKDCGLDSNCGGDLNPCTSAVCNSGTCGQKNVADGTSCLLGGACAGGNCCLGSVCSGKCCGNGNYGGCNGAGKCNI